jgi:beta-fructofuranosidase
MILREKILMKQSIFYKPANAWAADFIPFFENGRFHLFYLLDWRDPSGHGEGTPWYQISTKDFIHFTEHGEMLPRGGLQDQDLYVFTGSVIKAMGKYHIFYTGHNPHLADKGLPIEAIMHAESQDLINWQKIPSDTFFAPQDHYETHDWRDPYVFWNDEAQEFWMLLAARLKDGPLRRRGCTALCTSKDLSHWEVKSPFYTPNMYYTHECPDLFKWGDWWYLIFSEFSQSCLTRYRMSHSLRGPWQTPIDDAFDGHALYAAKTTSDGHNRYLFGWYPTRNQEKDDQEWQWGGNLLVHRLIQEADGTLSVDIPPSVNQFFTRPYAISWAPVLGDLAQDREEVILSVPGSYGCAVAGELPEQCKISFTVHFKPGTHSLGVALRASADLDEGCFIRIDPPRQRLVFDTWPRSGYLPHQVELERPIQLDSQQPVSVKVIVENTLCSVYVDNKIAMSSRLYNQRGSYWGIFAQEGSATFSQVSVHTADMK